MSLKLSKVIIYWITLGTVMLLTPMKGKDSKGRGYLREIQNQYSFSGDYTVVCVKYNYTYFRTTGSK
jgi:hypothetical protein